MTDREKPPAQAVAGKPVPTYPTYRSEELFAAGKVVIIVHAGREYILRITSAGKLILTA